MVRNKPIKNFASIKHGYAFSSQYFSKDKQDYILLTPGNFHIDKKLYFGSNTKYYSGPIDSEYVLSNGDLLVVMTDLTKNMAILGNAVILHSELPVLHNQRIGLIDTSSDVSKEYLCYLINSESVKRCIKATASGTTVRHTSPSKILDIRAYLPPLPEQQKIAKILTTWDKAISTTERLIDNSKQQKKALMQQLLTGKKRLLDENGERFEGEWKSGYLEELCDFKGGSAFKEKYQGKSEGDLPFIKVSDMNIKGNEKFIIKSNNWIMHEDLAIMKVKSFPAGSVVFAKVGAALLLNRRRILVRDTIIDNNMMAAMPKDICITSYLYYLMLAIDFAKLVQEGAVPSINQSDLGRFKIAYTPSHKEQQKIAAVLTNADKEIELLEQQLADLQQEKKALMQVLLTGKKRVVVDGEVV
ncbi:restriction endonuclease subunit S [Psychrobacter celer]|uniref:restriction endonuclease subunit S n=2 Tax=Psychrobacter celer TaxID=306572 RepID=UPI003FD0B6C3